MSQFNNDKELVARVKQWNDHRREEAEDAGEHYRYVYKGVKLDPFRIAAVYGMTDPALFTILKKVLRGGRAHKDLKQDLVDIISSAERKLEMMEEDLR